MTGKAALHILDAGNGKVIYKVPNPDQLFYTYPKFFRYNEIISAIRDTSGKMSLVEIDVQTGSTKYLTPLSYNVIGFPCISNDTIYFTNSFEQNDELFAYTYTDKQLWKLVYNNDAGLGKYQPTANGYLIAGAKFTP